MSAIQLTSDKNKYVISLDKSSLDKKALVSIVERLSSELLLKKHRTKKAKIHPKAGCMKGTFKMSSEFNEPIEDFKE